MDQVAYREKLKLTKQKSARLLRPALAAEYFGVFRRNASGRLRRVRQLLGYGRRGGRHGAGEGDAVLRAADGRAVRDADGDPGAARQP